MSDLIPFDIDGAGCRFGKDDDGTAWVVASDFAKLMGYRDARDAARLLDDGEKGTQIVRTPGGDQRMTIFYEDGIWELIFRSTLPAAKAIKSRVKAILREIRETGRYAVDSAYEIPKDYPSALELAARMARELETAERRAAELEPAARSWTELADAGGDFSLREAAQILRRSGVDTGQNRLSRYLKEIGWTDKSGQPYQSQVDAGRLVRRATGGYDTSSGEHVATWQLRITPKGVAELHRLMGGGGPLLLAV
jgi:prophage antirepressor-like protein